MSRISGEFRAKLAGQTAKSVLAAGAFFLAAVPMTANAECIRRVVSSEAYASYSDGEAKALHAAISVWSSNVKSIANSEYSNWGKAQQKSTSCKLSSNKKYYTCNVRAVPCR